MVSSRVLVPASHERDFPVRKFKVSFTIYEDQPDPQMSSAECRVFPSEIDVLPGDNMIHALFNCVYTARGEFRDRLSAQIAQAIWDGKRRGAFIYYGASGEKTASLTWEEQVVE